MMRIWKNKLSTLTGNTSKTFKKVAVSALAFTTLSLGVGNSSLAESSGLTTVYYVYLNNEYIGTVSNQEIIDNIVNEKLNDSKNTYDDNYELTLGSQLTYVSEQVFRSASNTNDAEVVEKLEEELAVEAEASALVIDGEAVAYLQDQETAENVIKALKLQYVTEEQLNELEARKTNPSITLPPLTENETRILDVSLSKEVSFSGEKVSPQQVLTVEQAVQLLTKGTLEEKTYKVREGDVLGSIAVAHDMKLAQLLSINPGLNEDSLLKIDQEINVTFLEPLLRVVVEKEVFKKETVAYKKEVVEDASMFKGDTKVKQEGKDGLREVTYKISEQNGVKVKQETISENMLQEPINHIVLKGTKVMPSRGDGSFVWPAVGGYVSSHLGYRWGKMHKGIDIARPSNRTIKAADNGVVVFAGWDGGYGNKIIVDHNNGYRTVYAHLSSITVNVGQTVPKGSKIGVMGSTGDSTGVHLHFEIYKNGSLKNPMDYL
ncbi:peptidoglycan DD-metalloendopeptidase family protein [Cytobacillus sp. FJAT-54145]|uniref:Peptidoglycan DD-metalloendopeptidase family protein n=1 Tax=Cytobacillus spartinae TaxID=3299023 RepID=A0ABW6KGL9_9BACI